MEEPAADRSSELLAKIHNQLIDLKEILVEIELANPAITATLRNRLRQLVVNDSRIDAEGRPGGALPRQQKVITPVDPDIKPGEANH